MISYFTYFLITVNIKVCGFFIVYKIIYKNRKKADASKKQAGKLSSVGMHTIGELAAVDPAWLKGIFGFHNEINFNAYTLLW